MLNSVQDAFLEKISLTIKGFEDTVIYEDLELHQSLQGHHTFKFLWRYGTVSSTFQETAKVVKNFLGGKVLIHLKNQAENLNVYFKGFITKIDIRDDEGASCGFMVEGCSPTIFFDEMPQSRIFKQQTLAQIAQTVTSDIPKGYQFSGIVTKLVPSENNILPYIVQYNETDFQLLERLATQYGKWFYFDGVYVQFGGIKNYSAKLFVGVNLHEFNISSRFIAQKNRLSMYDYGAKKVHYAVSTTPPNNSRSYFAQIAQRVSKNLYNRDNGQYAQIVRGENLQDLTKIDELLQQSKEANTITYSGRSTLPLQIGGIVKIVKEGVEKKFVCTTLRHHSKSLGHYNCYFEAIPSDVKVPPYTNPMVYPKAETQSATVTDNDDPQGMGRIKVMFSWYRESDWIRVLTPHAGGGKGFYFVPEIGEEVLIGFEGGNPEKPFVMGSHYNGEEKSGYATAKNTQKAIHTRSGTKIVMDDEQGSVLVEDKSGNKVFLDGNGNIDITAPKDINLSAGNNMNVNVGQNLMFNVGNQAMFNIFKQMMVNTPFLQQMIAEYYHTQAGKALINSDNEIKLESPEMFVAGQKNLLLHSDEMAVVNSKGTVQLKGEQGNKHSNVAEDYESVKSEIEAKCIVKFRPHDKYEGEFGFDWLRSGDSGIKGDNWFGDIMGKYFEADNVTVFKDTNNWNSNFKKDLRMYDKKLKSYTNLLIEWKSVKNKPYLYSIPILTLLKNNTAIFNLKIEIKEKPKKITFEFKNKNASNFFSLNVTQINNIKKGKYDLYNYLKITCNKEFNDWQTLYVKADGKICGALKIHPNTSSYKKKINIAIIRVRTDINGNQIKGKPKIGSVDFFRQCLEQALIIPNVVTESKDLDCTGNFFYNTFRTRFCTMGKKGYSVTKTKGLKTYLLNELQSQFGNKYNGYYLLFFIGEEASLNGYSYFNTRYATFFKGHNRGTLAHETFHSLNLPHTFDGINGKFTYQAGKTNNLMDYSHQKKFGQIDRNVIYYWQWKIINSKIK